MTIITFAVLLVVGCAAIVVGSFLGMLLSIPIIWLYERLEVVCLSYQLDKSKRRS